MISHSKIKEVKELRPGQATTSPQGTVTHAEATPQTQLPKEAAATL